MQTKDEKRHKALVMRQDDLAKAKARKPDQWDGSTPAAKLSTMNAYISRTEKEIASLKAKLGFVS